MPSRDIVAKELATIFKVVGHADRIRLIEELRHGEKDVNSLAQALDMPPARVSQHLALLRASHIVEERRDGRRHPYHLKQPEIARWIVEGADFIEERRVGASKAEITSARRLWSDSSGPG